MGLSFSFEVQAVVHPGRWWANLGVQIASQGCNLRYARILEFFSTDEGVEKEFKSSFS